MPTEPDYDAGRPDRFPVPGLVFPYIPNEPRFRNTGLELRLSDPTAMLGVMASATLAKLLDRQIAVVVATHTEIGMRCGIHYLLRAARRPALDTGDAPGTFRGLRRMGHVARRIFEAHAPSRTDEPSET